MPVKIVAAKRYSTPYCATSGTIKRAIAPVAAEIIPGRPPKKATVTAIVNEAYRPIFGASPAINEKAIASGINARATAVPARRSLRTLENQTSRIRAGEKAAARPVAEGEFTKSSAENDPLGDEPEGGQSRKTARARRPSGQREKRMERRRRVRTSATEDDVSGADGSWTAFDSRHGGVEVGRTERSVRLQAGSASKRHHRCRGKSTIAADR
jgi:hypothetical protein